MKKFLQGYFLFLIFMVPYFSIGATYTVTNTGDNLGVDPAAFAGTGTLRQAIIDANANPGTDIINFNIPGGAPFTIQLQADLPALWNFGDASLGGVVTLDATTQPGYAPGKPVVVIDGNSRMYQGIQFWAGSSGTIKGLIVINCKFHGIKVDNGVGNVTIQGNYIGVNFNNASAGNGEHGIMALTNCHNNVIGGNTLATRNIISGNFIDGINLSSSNNNTITGNFIGTDTSGTVAVPNLANGLFVLNSTGNTIGAATTGGRNIISGNTKNGISLTNTTLSTIQNNYVGTNRSGLAALGNGRQATLSIGHAVSDNHGIMLNGSSNNSIVNNVVSGNGTSFGTLPSPDFFSPNFTGNGNGINIAASTDITIQGNIVGLSANLTTVIRNSQNGIIIVDGSNNCRIGGSNVSERNYIGGQPFHGVVIFASEGTSLLGNYIGTGPNGTENFGNNDSGIIVQNSSSGAIGGTGTNDGNILVNSKEEHGIYILESDNLNIKGNYIGVNKSGASLPNEQNGIMIQSNANNSVIGGPNSGEKNHIAYNKANGINITDVTAFDNSIHRNSIYCNTLRGIELNSSGNDFVSLPAPVISATSTSTLLRGTSAANAVIEIFGTGTTCATCTANLGGKNVQGKNYIGTTTADASGNWTYDFPSGFDIDTITTTASELSAASTTAHSTSEFSACKSCANPTPTITGTTTVCSETNGITYTVTNNPGSSYTWTVPANYSIVSGQGTNSIKVDIGAAAVSGSISVTETNSGCSGSHALNITVNPRASTPGITGDNEVCEGETGIVYTVANTAGATYNWSVPTGGSIVSGQGTNSITVDFANGASSGNITVTQTSSESCADLSPSIFAVTVYPRAATPGIVGDAEVCEGETGVVFSVTNIPGATYNWSVPSGASIVSGQGTNSITVDFANGAASGDITVAQTSDKGCADLSPSVFAVDVNSNPTVAITGNSSVCSGSTNVVYSVTNNAGSTYNWTVGSGVTMISGQNSNSITVNFDNTTTSKSISVTEMLSSGCSASATTNITVNPLPALPVISGPTALCRGDQGVVFSSNVINNVSYNWTVPVGFTITSGQGTNSITVSLNPTMSAPGNVTLVITDLTTGCTRTRPWGVGVSPLPPKPEISGQTIVCAGETGVNYSVVNEAGFTYTWTLPSGASIVSGQGTSYIIVNFDLTASSGNIIVDKESDKGCINGDTLAIQVNPKPTPTITGTFTHCANSSSVVFQTTTDNSGTGSTYSWTATGGVSIVSQSANTVTVNIGTTGGNLTVTETKDGCEGTATQVINLAPSSITITGPTAFCAGESFIYKITPVPGTTYSWSVTGASFETFASTDSIKVNFANASPVTVTVTETNTSCGASSNIAVNSKATATINTPDNSICEGSPVDLTANITPAVSGTTYQWYLNNSPISTNGTSPIYTATSAGDYHVIVNIPGTCEVSSDTVTISTNPSPTVSLTADEINNCAGATTIIRANGNALPGTIYNWYLNGNLLSSGTELFIDITQSGDYTVAAHLGTCSDSSSVATNVNFFTPKASFDYSTPVCTSAPVSFTNLTGNAPDNSTITYTWNFDDGTAASNATNPIHAFDEGSFDVVLSGDWKGCPDDTTINVKVYKSPIAEITASGNTTICNNDPVILNVTTSFGNFDYQWWAEGEESKILSTTSQLTASPASSTNFIVQAINIDPVTGGGCYDYDTITINIGTPMVDIGPVEVCKDAKVSTSASVSGNADNYNYTWSTIPADAPVSIEFSDSLIAMITGNEKGNYQLELTIESKTSGCSNSDISALVIHGLPEASANTATDTVCAGTSIDLFGNGNNSTEPYGYIWVGTDNNFKDTIFYSSGIESKVNTEVNLPVNIYVLTVVDGNLCKSSDTVVVHTIGKQDLVIPNLITPNNDALNDELIIKDVNNVEILPGASIEVYNRWGNRVYTAENYDNRWGAHELSDGMYFYLLKTGCGTEEYKGWLQILGNVHQIRTMND